ncbi:MAG: hypothetical protein WCQ00_04065 [bacterium]
MNKTKFFRLFGRTEDFTIGYLAKHPFWYSFFGGVAVVLFWRGVWETADMLATRTDALRWFFYGPNQVIVSTVALILMGLMVSIFVGDRIIISGLRHEKKVEDRTEEIVSEEIITLKHIRDEIRALKSEIANK